jgi:putative spermidine/putrescine transport system substrate-binding protein
MSAASEQGVKPAGLTRRAFLRRLAGSSMALGLGLTARYAQSQPRVVRVLSGGGSPDACWRTAVWEPFSRQTGIRIQDTGGISLARIKAAVASHTIEWDITETFGEIIAVGTERGWFETVPWDELAHAQDLVEEARHFDYRNTGVGMFFFSAVIGWNTNAFPDPHEAPATWADFWNVDEFPGPRALFASPLHQIEIALLADGVPPDRLYPLDLDRAFASLDRIKPHVKAFWETGAQQVQLLASGEVVLSSVWNGRMFAAQRENQPVDFTFNQGIISLDPYSVLKGARNISDAWKVMNAMIAPQMQASFARCIGYGPTNAKAFDYLDPKIQAQLPSAPENIKHQVVWNLSEWAKGIFEAKLVERYNAWKLS